MCCAIVQQVELSSKEFSNALTLTSRSEHKHLNPVDTAMVIMYHDPWDTKGIQSLHYHYLLGTKVNVKHYTGSLWKHACPSYIIHTHQLSNRSCSMSLFSYLVPLSYSNLSPPETALDRFSPGSLLCHLACSTAISEIFQNSQEHTSVWFCLLSDKHHFARRVQQLGAVCVTMNNRTVQMTDLSRWQILAPLIQVLKENPWRCTCPPAIVKRCSEEPWRKRSDRDQNYRDN